MQAHVPIMYSKFLRTEHLFHLHCMGECVPPSLTPLSIIVFLQELTTLASETKSTLQRHPNAREQMQWKSSYASVMNGWMTEDEL